MIQPNDKEEILEAISTFSDHVDQKFDQIDRHFEQVDQRFEQVDQRFEQIDQRLDRIDGRLDKSDGRLDRIEATMVTKDYLDDKLADLRGDLIMNDRRLDEKINVLADHLESAHSLPASSATVVRAIKPLGR